MIGPAGFGDAHFIAPDVCLDYRIRFENDPNATAPAQNVVIRTVLDGDLDIRSFRIGTFGFGDFVRNITSNQAVLQVCIIQNCPQQPHLACCWVWGIILYLSRQNVSNNHRKHST